MVPKNRFIKKMVVAIFMFAMLLLVFQPAAYSAKRGPTAAEYGVVLNLAGKQRMLTQKMSKEMMLIALGVGTKKNLANLKKTTALFAKTLRGLAKGDKKLGMPPTSQKRIKKQLAKVTKIWIPFYKVIKNILKKGKVTKDQVKVVAEKNLPLLKQMNKSVKLYEKDASKAGLKAAPGLAVTINLAGKQRMLTQKMSKEFLLIAYGHNIENNKLNLLETYTLFERTLKGLKTGDETLDLPGTKSKKILEQLSLVQKKWQEFKPVIEFATDPKNNQISQERIETLADSNLPLLKAMNKAVGMYEKEAGKK